MVGAITSGQISEYIGRKGSLMIAAIPNIIGWLAISFARAFSFLYMGRLLEGFGVGPCIYTTKYERSYGLCEPGILLSYLLALFVEWRLLAVLVYYGGFLNLRLKKWTRALITRSCAIIPTLIVALIFDTSDASLDILNEWLNVLQSIQISFALIPLLCLVSKEEVMGYFKIGTLLQTTSWLVAALVNLINGYLMVDFFSSEWGGSKLSTSLHISVTFAPVLNPVASAAQSSHHSSGLREEVLGFGEEVVQD